MTPFNPPVWLRSPHTQSILSSSPMRKAVLKRKSQHWMSKTKTMLLNGAGGSHLMAYYTASQSSEKPLVIMIHGWEGTAESGYLLSLSNQLVSNGYPILRLILRDHDASHHLNKELFNSCRLDEVVNAVNDAITRISPKEVKMVGFSLGGNFTMRVTNELSGNATLTKAIAVCPVIVPQDTMDRLEHGPKIYHHYFKRKWLKSINKKINLFPDYFEKIDSTHTRSLRSLTQYFVDRYTDYVDVDSYFEGYALRPERFKELSTPIEVLMSKDDPIINAHSLEDLSSEDSITVHYTPYGGHCGFIKNQRLESWADEFILAQLES